MESSANFSAYSHYLICDGLRLAEKWPVQPVSSDLRRDLSLCSTLSLSGFRHSLRGQIDGENLTMESLFGKAVISGANTCELQSPDRNFVLTGVLVVNQANRPERLWVWVTDEVLSANYRAYSAAWFVWDESSQRWVTSL